MSVMVGVKCLLAIIILLLVSSDVTMSFVLKSDRPEVRMNPAHFRYVRSVTSRTWDFSDCAPGCKLRLGGKVLNKRNLVLTTADAFSLAPLMHNETLADRMYVWGKTATMEVRGGVEMGIYNNDFDIESLDLFEGDIVLGRENVDVVFGFQFNLEEDDGNGSISNNTNNSTKRSKRALGTAFDGFLWTQEIPWQFSENIFDSSEMRKIRDAILFIEENTCVRFLENPSDGNLTGPHVRFIKQEFPRSDGRGTGCWSNVGRQRGGQELSLGDRCFVGGVIEHELAHTLGVYHEHTRPDRDLYIDINITNLQETSRRSYFRRSWQRSRSLGIPYDYASAMHYGPVSGGKNKSIPTMTSKDPTMQRVMGRQHSLSFLDVKFINTLYNCWENCGAATLDWSFCKNGGYRDPNNCTQCKCPTGFAPPSCAEIVSPNEDARCGGLLRPAMENRTDYLRYGRVRGNSTNLSCAWLIKASSPGKRVQLRFTRLFFFGSSCREDYVEIRYKNITRAGARYCGLGTPKDIIFSHGQEVLILFNGLINFFFEVFTIAYKEESCGGCSQNPEMTEPVCLRTELYNCSVESRNYFALIVYGWSIPELRENTCFRDVSYCCPGYVKDGDVCKAVQVTCGSTNLFATAEEQSVTSPGYPNGYPAHTRCTWIFRAPVGTRIKLQFKGPFEIPANGSVCDAYVEVTFRNFLRRGERFCQSDAPSDVFYSEGDRAVVILNTQDSGYTGFNLTYTAENCGGCSLSPEFAEPVCFQSELSPCDQVYNTTCAGLPCTKVRKSTCSVEESYCCDGYRKLQDVCERMAKESTSAAETAAATTTDSVTNSESVQGR